MMMMMIAQMLSDGVKGGVCVWQSIIVSLHIHAVYAFTLQCFDTVGWAAGRASGL